MLYLKELLSKKVDYKKKSLNNLNKSESYEEIDTRLASGWYVDTAGSNKKKSYKTNKVTFTISKKHKVQDRLNIKICMCFAMVRYKSGTFG